MTSQQTADESAVGLVGYGLLGAALADRLRLAGMDVTVYDISPQRRDVAQTIGLTVADTAHRVFAQCSVVLLSLPSSDDVSVVLADLSQHVTMSPESHVACQVILDTTTGSPEAAIHHAEQLQQLGMDYLEMTVAGSSRQLGNGEATVFVAGRTTMIEKSRPVIQAITSRDFVVGEIGAAARFKLIHNLILGLHRAVLAEGLSLAEALGFDAARTLQILQQTPAASHVMQAKGLKMATAEYTPEARRSQHHKDVRLMLNLAENNSIDLPLTQLHHRLLSEAEAMGLSQLDNSAIIEVFRRSQ
ncbi:MAG: NAD(P)-dependent oxidoreductase [Planctomycetaceae bacterium]|nr:NAD(P)-dependent oxidoreductase [Planctomycetaceae bacterium]